MFHFLLLSFFTAPSFVFAVSSQHHSFQVQVLTQQKDVIWGFDFLSADEILFSERSGSLKILSMKNKTVQTIKETPSVWAKGQGGLLDVVIDPKNRNRVYLSFSEPIKDEAATAVGIGEIEGNTLKNFKKIFSAKEPTDKDIHFGSRLVLENDGSLFVSLGERNERDKAQDIEQDRGKIIRLNSKENYKAQVWSWGHRNPQGLTRNPETQELWEAEMGPRGGDELNRIEKGKNYGWPLVTYGKEYWGPSIGVTEKAGFQQPVEHWTPSISPSAIHFYIGDQFPKWKNNLFMATLSGQHLRRLKIENNKVVEQEVLLKDLDLRFRCVRTGLDGNLYFSTDDGKIGRLVLSKN